MCVCVCVFGVFLVVVEIIKGLTVDGDEDPFAHGRRNSVAGCIWERTTG